MTDQCEHGIDYDAQCAACESEIAEAKAAGAATPFEIGLYWKGREAVTHRYTPDGLCAWCDLPAGQHDNGCRLGLSSDEAEFHIQQLTEARDRAEARIERAERLIDSWEHDASGHSNPVFIGRLRECLSRDPAPVRRRGDGCAHQWLDRPESDTRECLICGAEVAG